MVTDRGWVKRFEVEDAEVGVPCSYLTTRDMERLRSRTEDEKRDGYSDTTDNDSLL